MKSSKVSAIILRVYFYYATFYGITFFGLTKGNQLIKYHWLKWYCLISRFLWSCCFIYYAFSAVEFSMDDSNALMLISVRYVGCFACSIQIMIMQYFHGQDLIRLVQRFFKIFQRVGELKRPKQMGYGGNRELFLLLVIGLNSSYVQISVFGYRFKYLTLKDYLGVINDMFLTIGANLIMQISIIAYLSLGYLFTELNSYICHELRNQFRELNVSFSRMRLKEACHHLDNCLAIYEEIQSLGNAFNRIFQFALFMVVMLNMTIMAMVSYKLVLEFYQFDLSLCGVVIKLLIDVILLSLTVYGATSNSRMIRRLSFENYYMNDEKEWNLKLEMFLNRLNFYRFRVRLLGLFEVSNEFTIFFLSGLFTYLIFIVQYGMKINVLK